MNNDFAMQLGQTVPLIAGAALLVFAALHDVAARTIPNGVCALLAVLGLMLRIAEGSLLNGAIAGLLVFSVATACWLRGWMGGGDVKLLAAAALFVSPWLVGSMVVATSLAGGLIGLLYLAASRIARHVTLRRMTRRTSFLRRVLHAEHWRLLRGSPLPYGSAIAAGSLFVIFAG